MKGFDLVASDEFSQSWKDGAFQVGKVKFIVLVETIAMVT